ncbi:MAG: hypothetical protein PHD60_08250 [Clostridia bacterium]|nr:hypothetical protein [Clostridia bacterium]
MGYYLCAKSLTYPHLSGITPKLFETSGVNIPFDSFVADIKTAYDVLLSFVKPPNDVFPQLGQGDT